MKRKKTTQTIEAVTTLIPACLSGDTKARETLARWCLPKIRRLVLLTYGNGPDADDLVQIVISRIISRLGSYRGDAGFYNWVERITVNALRDYFRSCATRNVREVTDAPNENSIAPNALPDQQYENHWILDRISEHLGTIKLSRRLPLVLALVHDYTAVEIAATLNITVEAARKRIQRGRKELTAILKKDPHFQEILEEILR